MLVEQLLRDYSLTPNQVLLLRAYPGEAAMPGMELLTVPANALGIEATALRTKLEVRKQEKGKKPTRRQVDTLLVHRVLADVSRPLVDTPMMLGPLAYVQDCAHSHLVLELNVLAFLLKLPPHVQLAACVHYPSHDLGQEARKPEFITVERAPDLIRTLLNDAFQQRKRAASQSTAHSSDSESTAQFAGRVSADTQRELSTQAADSHTGGSSPAHPAAPGRAPKVQPVPRSLQQQELFAL